MSKNALSVHWSMIPLLVCVLLLSGCGSDQGPVTTSIDPGGGASGQSGSLGSGLATGGALASADATTAPVATKRDLFPQVRFRTSHGEFTVKLDREHAPRTVENFLEYVERGQYDQSIFHFVENDYMVLGGGYTTKMEEMETRAEIINEAHNGLRNITGTIAMARNADYEHSATSQFFFNLAENSFLDHQSRENVEEYGYCVFGEVSEGMDVVQRIASVEVETTAEFQNMPITPIVIESVERVE